VVRTLVSNVPNWILNAHTYAHCLAHLFVRTPYSVPRLPNLQGVIREQRIIVDGLKRAAEVAEEHRLQEFQHDLERMDPVEAEVAQRTEQERALLVQREYEARLAELNAKCAREKARVRTKYQYDG
jgi:hypothetical protein